MGKKKVIYGVRNVRGVKMTSYNKNEVMMYQARFGGEFFEGVMKKIDLKKEPQENVVV